MKKALIIFAVFFMLTIAVPALVCFVDLPEHNSNDLVNIFRGQIICIPYCR